MPRATDPQVGRQRVRATWATPPPEVEARCQYPECAREQTHGGLCPAHLYRTLADCRTRVRDLSITLGAALRGRNQLAAAAQRLLDAVTALAAHDAALAPFLDDAGNAPLLDDLEDAVGGVAHHLSMLPDTTLRGT